MFKLEKFYPPGYNPDQYWDGRYAQEHIAGKSSAEFRKQGFWPVMEKYLVKGEKYLDVGCGIGGWIIFLTEQGYNVEGVDIMARTVRALTEYDPNLKVKVASMTRLPYADNSLDGVLAIGALEYVENKVPEAIAEVRRVLAPGGWCFMEVPIANVLRRLIYMPLKRLERVLKTRRGQQPTFSNYLFSPTELTQMFEARGFKVLELKTHELPEADSHYGLYIDFPFLRGQEQYKLNVLGRIVKAIANLISPWVASTGMVLVAKKDA